MEKDTIEIYQQIHFKILSVALRSDGIIKVSINGNEEIDVGNVVEVVSAIQKIGHGKTFPVLISVGEYTLPTHEARAYLATEKSNPFASAEAYVIYSFSQKLVGNVYLSFNKPVRPTRIFNSEEKAIEWLKSFI